MLNYDSLFAVAQNFVPFQVPETCRVRAGQIAWQTLSNPVQAANTFGESFVVQP